MKRLAHFITTMVLTIALVPWTPADEPSPSIAGLAGSYYCGDGLGVNCSLNIGPAGTYSYALDGCLGRYAESGGKAAVREGVLRLAPSRPNLEKGRQITPTKFLPVRWGDRMYLLTDENMKVFCNAINRGEEPRGQSHGQFYLGNDQWTKPVTGRPALPAPFDKMLLAKPLEGKVTRRIEARRAWVNLGSDHGVFPGMAMAAWDQKKGLFSFINVEAVEPDRCRVSCASYDSELVVDEFVSSHDPK